MKMKYLALAASALTLMSFATTASASNENYDDRTITADAIHDNPAGIGRMPMTFSIYAIDAFVEPTPVFKLFKNETYDYELVKTNIPSQRAPKSFRFSRAPYVRGAAVVI